MWASLCHLFAAAVSILLARQTGGGGATNSYEDFLVAETVVLGIRVDYHLFRTVLVFPSTHDAHAFVKLKLRIKLRLMAG